MNRHRPRVAGSIVAALIVLAAAAAVGQGVAKPAASAPERFGPPQRLSPTEMPAFRPRVSPDGRRVVFHTGAPAPGGSPGDIFVVNLDGTGVTRLAAHPADDRDPVFLNDSAEVVWASDRSGNYDLWRVPIAADGVPGTPEVLFALPGDQTEPAVSPLEYRFLAVAEEPCTAPGFTETELARYEKVFFTTRKGGRRSVWFAALDDPLHRGRLSPAKADCSGPAVSGDGLSLSWSCGAGTDRARVVHDLAARAEQDFKAAIAALDAAAPSCEEVNRDAWATDRCLIRIGRQYTTYEPNPVSTAAENLGAPAYSANQVVLVATARDGRLFWRERREGPWHSHTFPNLWVSEAVWHPDGRGVVFAGHPPGKPAESAIYTAETRFYLQHALNLNEFGELQGPRASSRLDRNHFVARPGTEKEFFEAYEKVHYAHRGAFVTMDAALQVFMDEFQRLLRDAEHRAADDLFAYLQAVEAHACGRLREAPSDAARRFLCIHATVPRLFLEAARAAKKPAGGDDPDEWAGGGEAAQAPVERVVEQLPGLVTQLIEKIDPAYRHDVEAFVRAALDHTAIELLPIPGFREPVRVDFTQFAVRGPYAENDLCGYFVAVMWLGLVPLPLDAELAPFVRWLDTPAAADPAAAKAREGLARVDRLIGAFMGQPVGATLGHLRTLVTHHPELWAPFQPEAVARGLHYLTEGQFSFRGVIGALLRGPKPPLIHVLPRRYGLDSEFFSRLTHPNVVGRGFPAALDVLAALGVPRARELALAEATEYHATYAAALAALVAESTRRPEAYFATDLYHGVLALVLAMATPEVLPPAAALRFAQNEAWRDRLVHSALAGYTRLKHQAVLYAFQEYGVECDGDRGVRLLVEQPVLPEPRGFVDPQPAFFKRLVSLSDRLYEALYDGAGDDRHEPGVEQDWGFLPTDEGRQPIPPWNARRLANELHAIAAKEVRGEPLSEADHVLLRVVGGLLEGLFVGTFLFDEPGPRLHDEGRTERGVALATDVYTNIDREQVLSLAVGRLLDLFVLVPDRVGDPSSQARRITQGYLNSFYEFAQPMAERLTDEAWHARLAADDAPPRPAWTTSFIEDGGPLP